jgi:hypothetical protein
MAMGYFWVCVVWQQILLLTSGTVGPLLHTQVTAAYAVEMWRGEAVFGIFFLPSSFFYTFLTFFFSSLLLYFSTFLTKHKQTRQEQGQEQN